MLYLSDTKDFDEVYDIMLYSFPESERRSKKDQLGLFSDSRYKIAAERGADGIICVFLAYWELNGVTFLEHFAVAEHLRGGGLGGRFLDELVKGLKGTVCLEAELPETSIAARRIAFYERHGFILNDYRYIQPPLGEGRVEQPLKVMSYGAALTKEQFENIRAEVYEAVYKTNINRFLQN